MVDGTNSVVTGGSDSGVVASLKIGEFPRVGVPRQDKNGADVYEVCDGVEVLACDTKTGAPGYYKVSALTVEQNCETVEVTLGGRSVIVSDNESLSAFDTATGRLAKYSPANIGNRLVPVFKRNPVAFGDYGDRDLGWLLGAHISDGWVAGGIVGYSKAEKCKRDAYVSIFRRHHENFTMHEYAESTGGKKLGDSVKIHLCSMTAVAWMNGFDLVDREAAALSDKRTSLFKRIPARLITEGSEEFLWGMLSGLLDGDGTIVCNTAAANGKPRYACRYSTSSKTLADDVCSLCYRLGIRYNITTVPPRGLSNTAYVVTPSSVDVSANIGKLSCIGERELSVLSAWRAAPSGMDKTDMIPISDKEFREIRDIAHPSVNAALYNVIMRTTTSGYRKASRWSLMRHIVEVKDASPSLYARVMNTDTVWYGVDSVTPAGKREVFDLLVEDANVFAVNNGIIVWDTMNFHVPATDKAAKQALEKMLPSKNLIALSDLESPVHAPTMEMTMGLYMLTKDPNNKPVRKFASAAEAVKAYRAGELGANDPVEIG